MVKIERDLENTRRKAAQAQQEIDKAEARYQKVKEQTQRKVDKGKMTQEEANALRTEAKLDVGDAEFDAFGTPEAYEQAQNAAEAVDAHLFLQG